MLRKFQNSQAPRCLEQPIELSPLKVRANRKRGVDVADRRYRDLRIENSLTNEHGDEVRLKKGAHVEVTVAGKDVNRRD